MCLDALSKSSASPGKQNLCLLEGCSVSLSVVLLVGLSVSNEQVNIKRRLRKEVSTWV